MRSGTELRRVRLAEQHGARIAGPHDQQVVGVGHDVGEDRRATGRSHARGRDQVLVRDRQAVQRSRLGATGERLVGPARGVDGALGGERHDGVHGRVHGLDAVEVGGEHLAGRQLPGAQRRASSVAGRKQSSLDEVTGRRLLPAARTNGPGANPRPCVDLRWWCVRC